MLWMLLLLMMLIHIVYIVIVKALVCLLCLLHVCAMLVHRTGLVKGSTIKRRHHLRLLRLRWRLLLWSSILDEIRSHSVVVTKIIEVVVITRIGGSRINGVNGVINEIAVHSHHGIRSTIR